MKNNILDWLRLPDAPEDENLDDPSTTERHAKIIQQKQFLRRIYLDYYHIFTKALGDITGKRCVELGSGGGFIKEVIPQTVATDILPLSTIDLCCSAQGLPFQDHSVDAFLMINVFHHVKEPATLLKEMDRCLVPGGKVVMIEPANTWWGRLIYRHLHHEPFDASAGWVIEGTGPLSDANVALPWIIFCRDRVKYNQEFPKLTIEKVSYHTSFLYLLSGGVSMKQLVPSFTYGFFKAIEWILTPIQRGIAMFSTISLVKQE